MFEAKFQSFEETADPSKGAERMAALRAELKRRGLDGYVVSRADPHQNEYVPPCEERIAWLSGFTGSAAVIVVLANKAVLFTDGRYALQAKEQVDEKVFSIEHLGTHPPDEWIVDNLPTGAALGYDPWRTSLDEAEKLQRACTRAGGKALPTGNIVDAVWKDRPAGPLTKIFLHDLKFAGESAEQKLTRIKSELRKQRLDALVLSDPSSVAWTFNIRGGDVAHTPLPLSWSIVPREGDPFLFVDGRKLTNEVRSVLAKLADIREPLDFETELHKAAAKGCMIRLDRATSPQILADIIEKAGGTVSRGADPVSRMKAIKNSAEIIGAKAAHLRDGVALAKFLRWLDEEGAGKSEIDAVAALETFRRETGKLRDISFPTISGSGPNGAIVHYRVTRKSSRELGKGELFLIDSGGQYEDGTTDVTRTVAIGNPSKEMRERFTLVLKGHIAIARALFPEGTTGAQIDSFARAPLWACGLDYDHGTGHGVGSYLSVHEGPARISKLGTARLEPGMILSNEPGYYRAGAYGIRIENLVLVTPHKAPKNAEKKLLGFETLTLAPIDRRLIVAGALSEEELNWLNGYHRRVRETLASQLDAPTRKWLNDATEPLPD